MKTIVWLLGLVTLAGGTFAAEETVASRSEPALPDAPPEWRGMLVVGDQRRFSLTTPGGTESAWIAVGGSFNDWELVEFREQPETILIRKGGLESELSLSESEILTADTDPATAVAQAEHLLRQMNFESMLKKNLEQQKEAATQVARQSMAQDAAALGVDLEEFAAFHVKMTDAFLSELDLEQVAVDMTAAYAEILTPGEMQAMAEFYATSAGRAVLEKAPQLQERMSRAMMTQTMAAIPKMDAMANEFFAGQAADSSQSEEAQE